jgi:hypothetical protein
MGNVGFLELSQALGQPFGGGGPALFLQELLQARAQGSPLGQIGPGLQGLEHALHGPALPLLKGQPVDPHLAAHFHRLAALGPDGQDGLGFLQGRVGRVGGAFAARR